MRLWMRTRKEGNAVLVFCVCWQAIRVKWRAAAAAASLLCLLSATSDQTRHTSVRPQSIRWVDAWNLPRMTLTQHLHLSAGGGHGEHAGGRFHRARPEMTARSLSPPHIILKTKPTYFIFNFSPTYRAFGILEIWQERNRSNLLMVSVPLPFGVYIINST